MIKILIINIFILIYLFIYTPNIISDNLYGLFFGLGERTYFDQNNKIIKFIFDHKDYDGDLQSYYIKNNLSKPIIDNNDTICYFKDYQYLTNKRIMKYSLFTSAVANLLYKIVKSQKRTINIVIVVSIRHQLDNYIKKGNYLKFACYKINHKNSIFEICKIHDTVVKTTKNRKYLRLNTTIYDIISSLYNFDYLINSHRNLSSFELTNGDILIKNNHIKLLHTDIDNLISIPRRRTCITLSFLDKHYIISDISYY